MKNASSYVKSLGFVLEMDGQNCIASRPLKQETVRELRRSNNFYSSNIYTKDGRVFVEGNLNDIALVASELADIETHSRKSVESLLAACPYKQNEISQELRIPTSTVSEELARLEKTGSVYKIEEFYFHQSFCERETAERIPLVLVEKYRACAKIAAGLTGTKLGQHFIDKAFFYKGLFLRPLFGGNDHAIHN